MVSVSESDWLHLEVDGLRLFVREAVSLAESASTIQMSSLIFCAIRSDSGRQKSVLLGLANALNKCKSVCEALSVIDMEHFFANIV